MSRCGILTHTSKDSQPRLITDVSLHDSLTSVKASYSSVKVSPRRS